MSIQTLEKAVAVALAGLEAARKCDPETYNEAWLAYCDACDAVIAARRVVS